MRPDETENATLVERTSKNRHSNAHLLPTQRSNQCKCRQCGEVFNSLAGFDRHQRLDSGRVICTHPQDLKDRDGNPKPLLLNAKGLWVTSLREPGAFDGDAS